MREFLKGLDLDGETIDKIMAEHGKVVTEDKEQLSTLTKQIEDANSEIQSYKDMDIESIKKSAGEWETKYKDLVEAQKAEKEKSIREERMNTFFDDVKFSSEMAKAGVLAKFNEKDFKYDEESKTFQGAKEWLDEIKKTDSNSFLSDVANPTFSAVPTAPTETRSVSTLEGALREKYK